MKNESQCGYTLRELLTVFTILSILLAIIIPVVLMSKRGVEDGACLANLHQINRALALYVADNDSTYPPAIATDFVHDEAHSPDNWAKLLLPYLNTEAFPRCPLIELPGRLLTYAHIPGVSGYAYNARLNRKRSVLGHTMPIGEHETVLIHPSQTITLFDARAGIIARRSPDTGQTENQLYGIFSVDFVPEILAQKEGGYRHHGGANYAFADGHTKWLLPWQIQCDKHSDGQRPGFGL